MSSLRARLVALCALVAIACTALCAGIAGRAIVRAEAEAAHDAANAAGRAFDTRLRDALGTLAAEAAARSAAVAAGLPLQPPAPGELAEAFIGGGTSIGESSVGTLLLSGPPSLLTGPPRLELAAGAPVASASAQHGSSTIVAASTLTPRLLARLEVPGWTLRVGGADAVAAPVERVLGGGLRLQLHPSGGDVGQAPVSALATVVMAGTATAAIAAMLAGILAWRWLRPLHALVDACRARAAGSTAPLPPAGDVEEAAVLRDALQRLLDGERAAREQLAVNLEREAAVNAVHQRFLAQLAHEFAQPIRALTGTIELIRSQGGRLEPERLAEAHEQALRLEERFQEVLGLAADVLDRHDGGARAPQPRLAAARYLADLAAIMRPQAERLGVELVVGTAGATDAVVEVDARLLSPVLVNLVANALRASAGRTGARVELEARCDAAASRWTIADNGPGVPEPLAARVAEACARGEVLPAEPGFGLGLALALANARALGGRLTLARNGAAGAAFELTLPRAAAARPSSG